MKKGLLIGLLTVLILLSGCESADNNSSFVGNANANTGVAIKSANTEILDYLKAPQIDYNECKCYTIICRQHETQSYIDNVKNMGEIVDIQISFGTYVNSSFHILLVIWYKENENVKD